LAGGIGLHIHNVRATGSHIRGTNGTSNGIVPMLRVFNNTAKYVDQCVDPETTIYTTHGPKQIQNCTAGETAVFNLLGETEVIQNVLEHNYEGEILEIETMHSLHPLHVTPLHPIFVLKGQQKGLNYKVIENRLNKKICQFEWIEANELTTDDMMVYPIPTHSVDVATITKDDCYMYGIILGDGCMNNSNDTGYVSMHTTNKLHIREFMETYFQEKLVDYKVDNYLVPEQLKLIEDSYELEYKKNFPTRKLKWIYDKSFLTLNYLDYEIECNFTIFLILNLFNNNEILTIDYFKYFLAYFLNPLTSSSSSSSPPNAPANNKSKNVVNKTSS
jgi:hypothetical protein